MLEDRGIPFEYREYRHDPLTPTELRTVLGQLGVGPRAVLRKNDRAYQEAGLKRSWDGPRSASWELPNIGILPCP